MNKHCGMDGGVFFVRLWMGVFSLLLHALWSWRFFWDSTMVDLGCAQQPRALLTGPRKCFILSRGQLHSSVCSPLPSDWPGMLEKGTSTDCFTQKLACYQLGGLCIGGEAEQNQQRQPGAKSGSENVQRASSEETSFNTTRNRRNVNKMLISLVSSHFTAFVVNY